MEVLHSFLELVTTSEEVSSQVWVCAHGVSCSGVIYSEIVRLFRARECGSLDSYEVF